jgi:hypothetical protein
MDTRVESKAGAQRLYEMVLQTSNIFLHNCKHFAIEILQGEDPSYAHIAQRATQVVGIIRVLSDDFDPTMGQKAHDHCELMVHMAVAIDNSDRIGLRNLVTEMERRSGL